MRSGLRQLSQHLLDEERVAVRALVHTWCELVAAERRAGEFGHVIQRQAAKVDPLEGAAAFQLAERRGEWGMPAELGVSIRDEDEHRSWATGAQQKAREQQAAAIGPVQIVDHE